MSCDGVLNQSRFEKVCQGTASDLVDVKPLLNECVGSESLSVPGESARAVGYSAQGIDSFQARCPRLNDYLSGYGSYTHIDNKKYLVPQGSDLGAITAAKQRWDQKGEAAKAQGDAWDATVRHTLPQKVGQIREDSEKPGVPEGPSARQLNQRKAQFMSQHKAAAGALGEGMQIIIVQDANKKSYSVLQVDKLKVGPQMVREFHRFVDRKNKQEADEGKRLLTPPNIARPKNTEYFMLKSDFLRFEDRR